MENIFYLIQFSISYYGTICVSFIYLFNLGNIRKQSFVYVARVCVMHTFKYILFSGAKWEYRLHYMNIYTLAGKHISNVYCICWYTKFAVNHHMDVE